MKHDYKRIGYDPATKTLELEITSDRTTKPGWKKWEVDPQLQIINLLKEIKTLLGKLVDRDPPYHTGPQTVQVDKTGLLAALEGPTLLDPES